MGGAGKQSSTKWVDRVIQESQGKKKGILWISDQLRVEFTLGEGEQLGGAVFTYADGEEMTSRRVFSSQSELRKLQPKVNKELGLV